VFRACVACHTLSAEEGPRAGPTLAGIFGRKIATLPGYNFSDALKKLNIVWTPETVSKLFELGPMTYTPGTKMPEQRIGSAEDRAALMGFLEKTRRPRGSGRQNSRTAAHAACADVHAVAWTSSSTASATASGVSWGRLWPATGITRC